jgi:F-type H+-transporting ATPase subunit delta
VSKDVRTLAEHFARSFQGAVLETLGESGAETVLAQLREMTDLSHGAAEPFFSSPAFSVEEKISVLRKVFEKSRTTPALARFVELLISLKHLDLLDDITRAFEVAENERRNEVVARVRTAFPLEPAEKTRLTASLSKITGKTVLLEIEEDPGLIGGVVAQVGSVVYDASIQGYLKRLQEEF